MGFFSRTNRSCSAVPTSSGLNRFQAHAQGIFVFLNRLAGRYRRRRAKKVLEILNDADIRVVLDVGTAAGQFWKLIHEEIGHIRIVGMDIRRPRSFPQGLFVAGSGLTMPFRDKSFDCVICIVKKGWYQNKHHRLRNRHQDHHQTNLILYRFLLPFYPVKE